MIPAEAKVKVVVAPEISVSVLSRLFTEVFALESLATSFEVSAWKLAIPISLNPRALKVGVPFEEVPGAVDARVFPTKTAEFVWAPKEAVTAP